MNNHGMTNENLEAALQYARIGLPVFPCRIRDEGKKKAKSPYSPNGFKDASTGTEQIKCWWANHPDAIIGMPTGKMSGLVVIDIDPRHGGDHSFQGLNDKHGKLPETLTAITGGGGTHYYFRYANREMRCSNGKLASGVDVKADGGYVILPPSGHESGKSYFWDGDFDLDAVAEMPSWFLELTENVSKKEKPDTEDLTKKLVEGKRNEALASWAGTLRYYGRTDEEIFGALWATNQVRCKPPLSEEEVWAIAKSISRYESDQGAEISVEGAPDVDLSGIVGDPENCPQSSTLADPGPIPEKLLRIPGFVSELMDFNIGIAPYPNQGLSFCGALAMQSFLCGRKIRDVGNLRTNIYLLALAGSSSGKDIPRQSNSHIMVEINKQECLGNKFSSGEAIQDAMFVTPNMLFQNDEIDEMLISLNKSRDARHESSMSTMLTMFTSSGSIYPMRRKAGKDSGGIIYQPHLTLYGTATPKNYYESLSERVLTNGFFARMLVIDIGYRSTGKDAGLVDDMPIRILETAKWWDQFCPTGQHGNLSMINPKPAVVTMTSDAKKVLDEYRSAADMEYGKAELVDNEAAKAIWGRANENARKLALLYAASENHRRPEVSKHAAEWAVQLSDHLIRRMLFLVNQHVYENEFDKKCKLMLKILAKWKALKGIGVWMPHWELGRRLTSWTEKDFEMVRESLSARLEIEFEVGSTPKRGRVGYRYRLC